MLVQVATYSKKYGDKVYTYVTLFVVKKYI